MPTCFPFWLLLAHPVYQIPPLYLPSTNTVVFSCLKTPSLPTLCATLLITATFFDASVSVMREPRRPTQHSNFPHSNIPMDDISPQGQRRLAQGDLRG